LPRCLKTALKRSKPLAYLLSFFLVTAFPAAAQEANLRLVYSPDRLAVQVGLTGYDGADVISAVDSGMRSRMTVVLRLYQKKGGITGILGDRLVQERREQFEARYDPFSRDYVISSETREQRYRNRGEFLQSFFSPPPMVFHRLPDGSQSSGYVLAQVRLEPMKMAPALRLLRFLLPHLTVVTPWKRLELAEGGTGTLRETYENQAGK